MLGNELSISVLGGLTVRRDGYSLPLPPSRKTRALLAYLAVTARTHRRQRLCDLFWNMPDDPRAALRWSLSHLRPLVDAAGSTRLIADRESVALDLRAIEVDILTLRERFRNGADTALIDDLVNAAASLEGDFLEGLDLSECEEFQSWCAAERGAVRRLRARILSVLIARFDGEDALPHARALAVLQPDNEASHVTLIRLLRFSGRLHEAAEHARIAERQLKECGAKQTAALRQALEAPVQGASPLGSHSSIESPAQEWLSTHPARHEVRFCKTSDGAQIAYAVVGNGPPLVWAAHWLSHLSFSWESPLFRHWTEEFSQDHRFVHYDERGNGLSDWDTADFTLDAFVRDLEAVVDTLGLDRFALIGMSKGASTSIAYAARHPERVSHLIIYGGYAEGWRRRGSLVEIERREAMLALMQQGWTQDNPAFRQINTSLFLPDATLEEMHWYNEIQRISTSVENMVRLQRALGDLNVLNLLPRIQAASLVLHCRDDAIVPIEQGRMIASRIPAARFVPLESRNHTLVERDPAWKNLVAEVRNFLAPRDG